MSTKTSHRRSPRELKAIGYAIGYAIADEIETVALHFISHGYTRKAAINLAIQTLAGV